MAPGRAGVITVDALRRAVRDAHAVLREHNIEPDTWLNLDSEAEQSILEMVDAVTPGQKPYVRRLLAKALKTGIMVGLHIAKDGEEEV